MLSALMDRIRFRREPLRYIVGVVVVAYIAYQVLAEGRAPEEILVSDSPAIAAVALLEELLRMNVFSPKSVEEREEADLDNFEDIHVDEDVEPEIDEEE